MSNKLHNLIKAENPHAYAKLANEGLMIGYPIQIGGESHRSDNGIKYHSTLKFFNTQKDHPHAIHDVAQHLPLNPPDPKNTQIEPGQFKDRLGNDVYVLKLKGNHAEKMKEHHAKFSHMGDPQPYVYEPHISVPKDVHDKIRNSGAKTAHEAGISFGPAELKRGPQTIKVYHHAPESNEPVVPDESDYTAKSEDSIDLQKAKYEESKSKEEKQKIRGDRNAIAVNPPVNPNMPHWTDPKGGQSIAGSMVREAKEDKERPAERYSSLDSHKKTIKDADKNIKEVKRLRRKEIRNYRGLPSDAPIKKKESLLGLQKSPFVNEDYGMVQLPYHPTKEGKYHSTIVHKPTGNRIHRYDMPDNQGTIYATTESGHHSGKVTSQVHVHHNDPESGEEVPHIAYALTEKGHEGKGLSSLLHQAALKDYSKIHGELSSDTRLSPKSQHIWEKMAKNPKNKVQLGSTKGMGSGESRHVATMKSEKLPEKYKDVPQHRLNEVVARDKKLNELVPPPSQHTYRELSLHHGTKAPHVFQQFDMKHHASGYYPGVYTTTDPERAKTFGRPVKVGFKGHIFEISGPHHAEELNKLTGGRPSGHNLVQHLKEAGYHGIKRGDEHIIFDPKDAVVQKSEQEDLHLKPLMKPYRSEAQRKWAHTAAGKEALGGEAGVHEWDQATKGKKLPEKVTKAEEPLEKSVKFPQIHKHPVTGKEFHLDYHHPDKKRGVGISSKKEYIIHDGKENVSDRFDKYSDAVDQINRYKQAPAEDHPVKKSEDDNLSARIIHKPIKTPSEGPGSYGNVKPHVSHKDMKNMGKDIKTINFHERQHDLHRQNSETAKSKGDHGLAEKHAKMAEMHGHYDTANLFGPHSQGHFSDRRDALKTHTDKAKNLHHELSKSEEFVDLEKGALKTAGMALGMAGAIAGGAHSTSEASRTPARTPASIPGYNQAPSQNASQYDHHKMLRAIAQVESNDNKQTNHGIGGGAIHGQERAYGKYGLMPQTIREVVKAHKDLKAKHGKILALKGDQLHNYMQDHPGLEDTVADRHLSHMEHVLGQNPAHLGYGWLNGAVGALKARQQGKKIENHWHARKVVNAYGKVK